MMRSVVPFLLLFVWPVECSAQAQFGFHSVSQHIESLRNAPSGGQKFASAALGNLILTGNETERDSVFDGLQNVFGENFSVDGKRAAALALLHGLSSDLPQVRSRTGRALRNAFNQESHPRLRTAIIANLQQGTDVPAVRLLLQDAATMAPEDPRGASLATASIQILSNGGPEAHDVLRQLARAGTVRSPEAQRVLTAVLAEIGGSLP